MSRYVRHFGRRFRVISDTIEDGALMLELEEPGKCHLWAKAAECTPIKQGKRRFKDGRHVLEYTSDGQLSIRRARSPKRYPLELVDIYNFAVRCSVLKGSRLPKAFRARRRK